MYSYIIGKIISVHKKSITLEHDNMGYLIYTPHPEQMQQGWTQKLFLYQHSYLSNKNCLQQELYGFKNYDEKDFFVNCINISGIGPKTAMLFLKNDINILKKLISNKDSAALEELPGINKKNAYLLVEYLSNFYVRSKADGYENIADVINVLKTLGYSQDDINFAINKLCETNAIENTMETSDVVAMAIKLISVKNETAVPKA